jgi:hypothetical protein
MLEKIIEELTELIAYKRRYESAQKDKQTMSDMLYDYMLKEYEATPYEERCKKFHDYSCIHCKNQDYCLMLLKNEYPEDILMPVKSDSAWIPPRKGCGKFESR